MMEILVGVILYLIGLVLMDHVVTGKIAPEGPHGRVVPDGVFRAYVLSVSLSNLGVVVIALATYVASTIVFSWWTVALLTWTIMWCWYGGALDFLYFTAAMEIPDPDRVWFWFPGGPTTAKVAVWAFCSTLSVIIGWILHWMFL
jgi:hypothetical protein